ncbi:MAG: DUF1343 domain-containing protein [Ignavibacteriales bacterium]|nr:DUF1343 domain-containing protein [Ignavibacteriales bacterium]
MKRLSVLLVGLTIGLMFTVQAQVLSGADLLLQKHFSMIQGKRVGLVTNHSALLADGRHLADALAENPEVKLVALFGPEHGIRGDAPAGAKIQDDIDGKTGAKVYSLYGRINKPTPEMLQGVDVLVFDIFDVGARFYTYESTMSHAMEAAAENNIPYIVLDRPNPIRGTWVEGFIRLDSLRSFVGLHPIPIAHGLTMGELATLYNGEGWLKNHIKAQLTVIRMEGWKRSQWYDETGLKWVKPSPNIPTLASAVVYPGTCFFEGTNLSEGRGTEKPFEYIGAPYVHGAPWAQELNSRNLPGVRFEPIEFTPKEIPGAATNPKHKGALCGGVFVNVMDRNTFEPIKTAIHMLSTLKQLYPSEFQWRPGSIDRLSGTPNTRLWIDAGESPEKIVSAWKAEVKEFENLRAKYLLY